MVSWLTLSMHEQLIDKQGFSWHPKFHNKQCVRKTILKPLNLFSSSLHLKTLKTPLTLILWLMGHISIYKQLKNKLLILYTIAVYKKPEWNIFKYLWLI